MINVSPRVAQNTRLEFLLTINNAIILYDSMPAEAEILHEKGEPEQRTNPRSRLQENPACARARRDHVREERISLRLELVIDQQDERIDGRNISRRRKDIDASQ